ncbi:hypothetical protein [Mycobacterium sp.]|uniref:hypothetical protein n=1 Tax=Mycobacterium sp. TaxID=1785 RepID=UPI003C791508
MSDAVDRLAQALRDLINEAVQADAIALSLVLLIFLVGVSPPSDCRRMPRCVA